MGRGIEKLRELIGLVKDKASQSRAILSKPATVSLHLALLRATTHDLHAPPTDKHLDALSSFDNASRAALINALADRLQRTRDSSVAVKCLIAVHHIAKNGAFTLRDNLSGGGKNYLNLSDFRDASTPTSWDLSCWVRWLAQYVEHLMCTTRVLGFFLCSSSGKNLSSVSNSDLIKEVDSLVGLVEEMCKRPHTQPKNKIVIEIMCMVGEDYLSAAKEISIRVSELGERLGQMGFIESVELMCLLKRVEDCKEKVAAMVTRKKAMMEAFWVSIAETKERVWSKRLSSDQFEMGRRFMRIDRKLGGSARFPERVLGSGDSLRFPSARFGASVSFKFPLQSVNSSYGK